MNWPLPKNVSGCIQERDFQNLTPLSTNYTIIWHTTMHLKRRFVNCHGSMSKKVIRQFVWKTSKNKIYTEASRNGQSEIGRPSISNKFPTMPTTSFNLHPRNLNSTCQSQKLHNTKNPPKSDDIPESLWCACYKFACININLETEHFGTTELCNHHLPSSIKAINFKTTGASNTDSQLSNPTARHRGRCFNLQVIITSWLPSYFLVACGTPTASIFIWVN